MTTLPVRILSTTIAVPLEAAYAFASQPANFPKWAAGLSQSLSETDAGWIAETPAGQAHVAFTDPNPHGVLDHWVRIDGQPEIYIPLRMIANGSGTEVELTLFRQPGMSDDDFERDAASVTADLAMLKALLENAD